MVGLLCDGHLSDALECTTALLMVLLGLTCVYLATLSTLAGSMQPQRVDCSEFLHLLTTDPCVYCRVQMPEGGFVTIYVSLLLNCIFCPIV